MVCVVFLFSSFVWTMLMWFLCKMNCVIFIFGMKRNKKGVLTWIYKQKCILLNLFNRNGKSSLFVLQGALSCPALPCRTGQEKGFLMSHFFRQDRTGRGRATGQDRAQKSALWTPLVPPIVFFLFIFSDAMQLFYSIQS